MRKKFILTMCLVFVVTGIAFCQITSGPATLKVKFTQDFEFKGDGASSQWESAEWVPLTYRGGSKKNYTTQMKILYSEKGIYTLIKCDDEKIVSTIKEDFGDLWHEDVVELFLWPDESIPLYFEYELSPSNYELAIMVPNVDGRFFGWRPWNYEGQRKTRHATNISPSAWTAEFFIPYALLQPLQNVPPSKGMKWRANMYRIDYDDGSTRWSWQLTEKNFHDYKRFGTLLFE